ncbi:inositol monophosphatase [Cryphonectria parasitica EP155]|uniref:Inositol-1-monophosphatase n=1 Tax=Cryphonectria parasitica (strain ATCC 38755 / EP155) TaxID=660469 RepID=A0A9P5CNR6_CRYP1|nr:inositol monophosphatase [Cryphonectria parasitica EP155]KAF3764210.1 inositol monophosphatase [Cryphonectria parasitica EP155]
MAGQAQDQISEQELDEIYAFAIQLGKDAGEMLMDGARVRMSGSSGGGQAEEQRIEEKENAVDIVTKTDTDVEAFIHQSISKKYPHHKFIGEETYSAGSSKDYLIDPDHPTWCVDPLDGTVNYTHLFPTFCVSIALIVRGSPIIGIIYAPFMNQLFTACRGRGAFLNGSQRLPFLPNRPIPPNAPKGCVFGCEWGKDRRDPDTGVGNLGRKIESFVTMAVEPAARRGKGGMVHGVRSLGSAALDMAYTASGSLDIWWEGGCWEWDVAAGIAILLEAGGLVTTANPPEDPATAEVPDVRLGSRLYLAIRPAGPSETETARQGQERVVREVWKRVKALDYSRPGA